MASLRSAIPKGETLQDKNTAVDTARHKNSKTTQICLKVVLLFLYLTPSGL